MAGQPEAFVAAVSLPGWVADVLDQMAALVLDARGRLVAVSTALEEMLGVALRERLGVEDLEELTIRASERAKARQLKGLLLSGRAATMGVRRVLVMHQRAGGEAYPLLSEYHPVFDPEGQLSLHLLVSYEPSDAPRRIDTELPICEPTLHEYTPMLEAALGRLSLVERTGGAHGDRVGHLEPSRTGALSRREHEVLDHLLDGKSAKDIAAALHVSVHTIKTHTRSILKKCEVRSRSELLARFLHQELSGRAVAEAMANNR